MKSLIAVVGASLVVAACGQGDDQSTRPSTAPAASSRPSAGPSADPAPWRARGATEAPPSSVGDVSLGQVQVVNQTGGAVSDDDARRWALAYLRANAYELWAWNHMQDGFLLRAGLSEAPGQVFGYDLTSIQQARAAGARVEVTRLALRRLVLRSVPESLRQQHTSHLFSWTPYAFYLDQIGPSEVNWVDAKGARTNKARQQAGVGAPELIGGRFVTDPLMGEIWQADSDWDCTAPGVRQVFGPLCNQ